MATVGDDAPDWLDPVLPTGTLWILGANVLGEQKRAGRPEHPTNLGQRASLVVHRAEDDDRDDRVERVVLEGQLLGRRLDDCDVATGFRCATPCPAEHWLGRICNDELVHRWVVGEAAACSNPDLEYPSFRLGEQLPPQPCAVPPFPPGAERVVARSKDPVPQAHVANLLDARGTVPRPGCDGRVWGQSLDLAVAGTFEGLSLGHGSLDPPLRDAASPLWRRFLFMAAILFFVAILGLLYAGRMQAQITADGSKPLFSFQVWQLGLALALPLLCAAAQIPTIAKVLAVAATAAAFAFAVLRARRVHDADDLYF